VYAAQLGFAQAHPLCQWSLWQIKQAEKIPNLFQPSEVISQLIHGLQLQTNWTLSLCALKFKDHLPLCGSKNVYLVIAPCAECIVSVELIKMIKYSWAPYRAPFFLIFFLSLKESQIIGDYLFEATVPWWMTMLFSHSVYVLFYLWKCPSSESESDRSVTEWSVYDLWSVQNQIKRLIPQVTT